MLGAVFHEHVLVAGTLVIDDEERPLADPEPVKGSLAVDGLAGALVDLQLLVFDLLEKLIVADELVFLASLQHISMVVRSEGDLLAFGKVGREVIDRQVLRLKFLRQAVSGLLQVLQVGGLRLHLHHSLLISLVLAASLFIRL